MVFGEIVVLVDQDIDFQPFGAGVVQQEFELLMRFPLAFHHAK